VLQRLARFADFFICQREIVMRIGIGGSQLQCRLVGLNRFVDPSGLVEDVAKIEVRQRVARIRFDGFAIMMLG
jgi:hypothetical protein